MQNIYKQEVIFITSWSINKPGVKMDEIFKNNTYKILEQFIEQPNKDFSARGIARTLKISHATVLKHIHKLEKQNLIKKKQETLYPTYYANTENQKYKFYKKNRILTKINNTDLINKIQKETMPTTIILYGSTSKGTYTENSDIDIYIEAQQKNIDTKKYEEKLNKKINLLFEPNIDNLTKELKNNILNGTKLYGQIKIDKNGK